MLKIKSKEELSKKGLPSFEDMYDREKAVAKELAAVKRKEISWFLTTEETLMYRKKRKDLEEELKQLEFTFDLMTWAGYQVLAEQSVADAPDGEPEDRDEADVLMDGEKVDGLMDGEKVDIVLCEEMVKKLKAVKSIEGLKAWLLGAFGGEHRGDTDGD